MIVLHGLNINNIHDYLPYLCNQLETDDKLCLYGNKELDDECIRILCNVLVDKYVTYIDVGKCPFTDSGAKMLYDLVCRNKSIEWIHPFDYPGSFIEGYDIFCQIKKNKSIMRNIVDLHIIDQTNIFTKLDFLSKNIRNLKTLALCIKDIYAMNLMFNFLIDKKIKTLSFHNYMILDVNGYDYRLNYPDVFTENYCKKMIYYLVCLNCSIEDVYPYSRNIYLQAKRNKDKNRHNKFIRNVKLHELLCS